MEIPKDFWSEQPLFNDDIFIGQQIIPGGVYYKWRKFIIPLTSEELIKLSKTDGTTHTFNHQVTPIHIKLPTSEIKKDLDNNSCRVYGFKDQLPPLSKNKIFPLSITIGEIRTNMDKLYPCFQRELLPQDQPTEGVTGELKTLNSIIIPVEKFRECQCRGITVRKGKGYNEGADFCPIKELEYAEVNLEAKSILIRWKNRHGDYSSSTHFLSQVLNRDSLPQLLKDLFVKLKIR